MGLAAALGIVLLGRLGLLALRLKPYWLAAREGEFAKLRGATLSHARLPGAFRGEAHGGNADLRSADLRWANLTFASLNGADRRDAELAGASLWGADGRNTDPRGAKLVGANRQDTQLTGARFDARTRWPRGFDPRRHGAVRE